MKRRLIRAIKGESGQALPIVLVLLGLGGLLIAPSLNYASTSLNAGQIVEKNVNGLYAADAGVENAVWCIKNSFPSPGPLNINQMEVIIHTEPKGTYTLYYGKLEELRPSQIQSEHYKWLAVYGEMGEWDPVAEAYPYTITITVTVTWWADPGKSPIKLEETGVRLPVGYNYVPGSAASFLDNLSTTDDDDEFEDTLDGAGAHMLNWALPPAGPPQLSELNPTRTQTFYVTGEGGLDGDYAWVGANPNSIGQVGEVIGTRYGITAEATSPGDVDPTAIVTKVTADVILYETEEEEEKEITILLWQINPQQ